MRLHRLLGIIMLLDSKGVIKAGKLADILETSERTIYRDIDILCEAGIPIMSVSGPNGGYSFMENYRVNFSALGSGDIVSLLLSGMGITPEKNSETAQKLQNALIRLENSVSEEHKEELIRAKEKFFIDVDPWWGKRVQNKHVDMIKRSVLNLNKIKVYYKKHGCEISERVLRPYGVVVKNSEWYVIAYCESKGEIRVFKCSRIENIEVLDESFLMPEGFNLEEFWEKSKQQFVRQASVKTVQNSYPVKVRFNEADNQLLQGFSIISCTKLNDQWIYEIDMLSLETACNVIFPFSDRIEVIEPMELRDFIVEKTKKVSILYKTK